MAWLSPSYPIGAFSFSHGLEYAIHSGCVADTESLLAWIKEILRFGAGRNDAILLFHAYQADDQDSLSEVSDLAEALCASSERHLETMAQGAAFAKVTSAIYVDLKAMPLPVALGAAAAREGIPLADVLPLYLHNFAANIIAAGVRFIPIGQTDGQRILLELFDLFESLSEQAMQSSLDDLGSASFLSDIAAMKHEHMTTRIFRT
jgi:urease accessory protein